MLKNRILVLTFVLTITAFNSKSFGQSLDKGILAGQNGDFEVALQEIQPLADQGDPEAQYVLGQLYYQGLGVPQNINKAFRLFRASAEKGVLSAQAAVAMSYLNGIGTTPDFGRGYLWLLIASNSGFSEMDEYLQKIEQDMTPIDRMGALSIAEECRKNGFRFTNSKGSQQDC